MAKAVRRTTVGATSRGIKHGYRSGLEDRISEQLNGLGVPFKYEEFKIKYEVNEIRTYTPDFRLDIMFVFSNSKGKISKGSKTSYADWCDKHGYSYADKLIPEEWIKET